MVGFRRLFGAIENDRADPEAEATAVGVIAVVGVLFGAAGMESWIVLGVGGPARGAGEMAAGVGACGTCEVGTIDGETA